MKAVVITGPRAASLEHLDPWPPRPGEALVRCQAAAVCTVERQLFAGARGSYPAVGGHEVTGVVEQVDDPEAGLVPGDRVVLDAVPRCLRCDYCLRGQDHFCAERHRPWRPGGFVRIGGGFAEYTTVPARQALKLPGHVTFEEGSLVEPLACCLHSVRRCQLRAGDTLLVGAGTMGCLHLLLARRAGVRVVVSDVDESRLRFAAELGAAGTVNPSAADLAAVVRDLTAGRGAEAAAVTAASAEAAEQALAAVAPLGRVVLYASCHPPLRLALDWNRVHYAEYTVTGSAGKTAEDFHDALDLLGRREVDLCPLIARTISLADLPGELAASGCGPGRVIVRHSDAGGRGT
jgi:L-iditol 2-dehydrogenase